MLLEKDPAGNIKNGQRELMKRLMERTTVMALIEQLDLEKQKKMLYEKGIIVI